jgi:predicted TIM-barrel fold metal-dependent hydrolase
MIDGPSTLMYSSDWPHRDFDSPVAIQRLSFLSEAEKAQILGGNACRALRFNGLGRPVAAGAGTTREQ